MKKENRNIVEPLNYKLSQDVDKFLQQLKEVKQFFDVCVGMGQPVTFKGYTGIAKQ